MEIKKRLRSSKNIKKLYMILRGAVHYPKYCRDAIHFKRNSMRALKYTQENLEKIGIPFFFGYGTLLGIVRDKKFITHDMDLDMGMLESREDKIIEIRDYLISKGYRCDFEFSVEDIGIVQHAFSIYGIRVDIGYLRTFDGNDHSYALYDKGKVVMFTFTHIVTTKNMNFNGIEVTVPSNPELFLEQVYGKSWRIPDPKYKYWDNESVIHIDKRGHTKVMKGK